MKSYFAKLAVRATPIHLSVVSTLNTAHVPDPFEQSSAAQTSSSEEIGETDFSIQGISGVSPDAGRKQAPIRPSVHGDSTILRPRSPASVEDSAMTAPRPVPVFPPAEPTASVTRETPPQITPSPQPDTVPKPVVAAPISNTREIGTTLTPPPEAATPQQKTDSSKQNQIANDESVLLGKADLFMERLIDRGPILTMDEAADRSSDSRNVPGATVEPEPMPRLQAIQPAAATFEKDSVPPTLFIGSLIVELAPTAPAPLPLERVVTVRRPRRAATPKPSSRRFGLGQF